MNKDQWGNKLQCGNCGAKFYDLNKDPILCPKCESPYLTEKTKVRRSSVVARPAPKTEQTNPPETEDEIIAAEIDDEILDDNEDAGPDDTVIEDTSDIGGDENDIGDVIGPVSKDDVKE